MTNQQERTGPLRDVVVLDLSRVLSGPFGAMILGDLGARVIKIERPGAGDDTRAWGPPFVGEGDEQESTYFLSINRNKESVELDFKSEHGQRMLTQLIRRSDVLVENFRTGVLDRLGFSFEQMHEINPGLVIVSITGFGFDGPSADRTGYDQIIQGEAGVMSVTGHSAADPLKVGVPVGDIQSGMFAALGALAGLHERNQTGKGSVVRTSLFAALISTLTFQGTRWLVGGEVPEATGNQHPTVAPYGAFACAEGTLQIAIGNDSLWRKFAPFIGVAPDDPRFLTNRLRAENLEALQSLISTAFAKRTADEWVTILTAGGVPVGKIRTIEGAFADPQVASQKLIVETQHPTLGTVRLPGAPLRMHVDGEEVVFQHTAPPTLGQHTESVTEWLGLEVADVRR